MYYNGVGDAYDKMAFLLDSYAFSQWRNKMSDDNSEHIQFLHNVLKRAQVIILTPTQQAYLNEYYINRLTQAMIAEKYGVVPSTVSRTITTALHKLALVLECVDDSYAGISKKFTRPRRR